LPSLIVVEHPPGIIVSLLDIAKEELPFHGNGQRGGHNRWQAELTLRYGAGLASLWEQRLFETWGFAVYLSTLPRCLEINIP